MLDINDVNNIDDIVKLGKIKPIIIKEIENEEVYLMLISYVYDTFLKKYNIDINKDRKSKSLIRRQLFGDVAFLLKQIPEDKITKKMFKKSITHYNFWFLRNRKKFLNNSEIYSELDIKEISVIFSQVPNKFKNKQLCSKIIEKWLGFILFE